MSTNVTPLPFVPLKSDPSLTDVLNAFKQSLLVNLNCHHIGTIQSFDPITQKASASINYKRTFFKLDESTGLYENTLIDYPTAVDMPVICLGGGDTALTFPIQQGDECLILFNDRDLDNWYKGAGNGAVNTPRLHSFADGVIMVGLRSLNNVLEDYDTTRAVLRNGTTIVGVGPTLIKIANATYTLNTLLQTLITQIESLVTAIAAITVTCAAPGDPSSIPINAAAITAIGTELATTAMQIGDLLE